MGHKGNNLSELNFPVAVTVNDDGIIMILDKHRYNVVCYNMNGTFLGEFGGKGYSLGWFYHPTKIASDGAGMVYIGQIYLNRVQICSLPRFIIDKQKELNSKNLSDIDKKLILETLISEPKSNKEVVLGKGLKLSALNESLQFANLVFVLSYYSMEVLQNA